MLKRISRAARIAIIAASSSAFPFAASAADGIEGTATLSRRLKADITIISFSIVERTTTHDKSHIGEREAEIRAAIEKAGATIAQWSSVLVVSNVSIGAASNNYLSGEKSEPQAADLTRKVRMQLRNVDDLESIVLILGRYGVRQSITFAWSAQDLKAEKERLAEEALAAAAAKARANAVLIGAKPGRIVHAAPAHVERPTMQPSMVVTGNTATFIPSLYEVVQDGTGRYVVLQSAATVTIEAAP